MIFLYFPKTYFNDFENFAACISAVLGLSKDGDGFFDDLRRLRRRRRRRRIGVSFGPLSMNVDSCSCLLCDLSNCLTSSANYGTNHVALDQNSKRKINCAPIRVQRVAVGAKNQKKTTSKKYLQMFR